ncbi:MAG: SRPBCC family protein [Thermoanaerobaculia bacterium]|nr:SRPBCC family protein [Thermoanaerobaculia bacterium]
MMPTETSDHLREIRPCTERVRVRFSQSITVGFSAEEIYPLLCPVREFDWIPYWDCKLIYSESGIAERNCVFQTDKPGEGVDTWVVSHYEPPRRISFVRIDPRRAMQYDIFLKSSGDTTNVVWNQEITALNEEGDRFVGELKESDFAEMIAKVELMLEHFLRTGEPLRDS